MAPLAVALLIGTFAYLGWRWRTTTLTRFCRWRRVEAGHWQCAFCAGVATGAEMPKACVRQL